MASSSPSSPRSRSTKSPTSPSPSRQERFIKVHLQALRDRSLRECLPLMERIEALLTWYIRGNGNYTTTPEECRWEECDAVAFGSIQALADEFKRPRTTVSEALTKLEAQGRLFRCTHPAYGHLLALAPLPALLRIWLPHGETILTLTLPSEPPPTAPPEGSDTVGSTDATVGSTDATVGETDATVGETDASPIIERARDPDPEDPEEGVYTTTEVAPPPVHPSACEPVVVPPPVQDAPLASSPHPPAEAPPTPDAPSQSAPHRTPPAPASPDRTAPAPRRAKASRPPGSAKKASSPRPLPTPEADPLDPDAALEAARARWGLPEIELIPKPLRMTPEALQQGFLQRGLPWEPVQDLALMLVALLAAEQLHSLMDSIQAASDEPGGIRFLRRFLRAAVCNILDGHTRTPSRAQCPSLRPWLVPGHPEPTPHSTPPIPEQNLWKNIDLHTFKQMFFALRDSERTPAPTRGLVQMFLASAHQCVQQLHPGLEHSDEDAWEQQTVTRLARLLDDARIPLPQLTEPGELHEEETAMPDPEDG